VQVKYADGVQKETTAGILKSIKRLEYTQVTSASPLTVCVFINHGSVAFEHILKAQVFRTEETLEPYLTPIPRSILYEIKAISLKYDLRLLIRSVDKVLLRKTIYNTLEVVGAVAILLAVTAFVGWLIPKRPGAATSESSPSSSASSSVDLTSSPEGQLFFSWN